MENQAGFNLKEAIADWQEAMRSEPAISLEQQAELEAHLLDSIQDLQKRGLNEEEAFFLSARRLGRARDLSDEFAKAHPGRIWTERVFWMATGVAAMTLGNSLFGLASSFAMSQFHSHLFRIGGPSWAWLLMWSIPPAIFAWVGYRLSCGHGSRLAGWIDRTVSHKGIAFSFVFLVFFCFLCSLTSHYVHNRAGHVHISTSQINIWTSALLNLMWPAVSAGLLVALSRKRVAAL